MKAHCCKEMRREVERVCDRHPDRFDCPDCLIHYSPAAGGYLLIIYEGGHSARRIRFCPWCGARLPWPGAGTVRADDEHLGGPLAGVWAVWRINDNTNKFLVRGGLTRAEAERVAFEFAARGDQQTIWVERDAEPGGPPDASRDIGKDG